ncbi:MAG: ABC transporter permease [Acidobacteria bacterium]|nr:ABC transporter permease [Acidobacteriota bacterium]
MKTLWAIALKELRQVRRDRLTLLMLLGLPALMLLMFGYALNFDVRHVALAVQDRDLSAASRELVSSFVNSTYFDLALDAPPGTDLGRITERRRAKAILVIPHGFGEALAAGRRAPVQLIIDGTDANTASAVLGYATALAAAAGPPAPALTIDYRPRVWYNPELKSSYFLVPGLVGFILMITGVLSTALSVVREKERGTMEQLRATPLRGWQLIVGKTLPYLGISLAATAVIFVSARLLFGLEIRGPLPALFAVTLLYLVGALGWGLLISTLLDSQAMAFQVGAVSAMLPALFLSGFIFPIRSLPVVLQAISYVVPARHYLTVLRGIVLKGAGLGPFGVELGILALYATIVLAIAAVRLARQGTA